MGTYRNAAVEADIARELGVDSATAAEVFQRLLSFLDGYWVARDLRSPTHEVDCAWHAFILHTQAYMDYCTARFGSYLHHDPEVGEGVVELARCSVALETEGRPLADVVPPLVAPAP